MTLTASWTDKLRCVKITIIGGVASLSAARKLSERDASWQLVSASLERPFGVGVADGGVGTLVDALEARLLERGVAIQTNAAVERVQTGHQTLALAFPDAALESLRHLRGVMIPRDQRSAGIRASTRVD